MIARKLSTAAAATVLATTLAVSVPVAHAYEPGTEPVTEQELVQGSEEISFSSSAGFTIIPQQTLTLTADSVGENIAIRNAYVETGAGRSSVKWNVERSVNEEGLPVLTITAPDAPENQTGEIQQYGEYRLHLRTSNWNSYYIPFTFAAQKPVEEDTTDEPPAHEWISSGSSSSWLNKAIEALTQAWDYLTSLFSSRS